MNRLILLLKARKAKHPLNFEYTQPSGRRVVRKLGKDGKVRVVPVKKKKKPTKTPKPPMAERTAPPAALSSAPTPRPRITSFASTSEPHPSTAPTSASTSRTAVKPCEDFADELGQKPSPKTTRSTPVDTSSPLTKKPPGNPKKRSAT